jgi:hypothetical protein
VFERGLNGVMSIMVWKTILTRKRVKPMGAEIGWLLSIMRTPV